MNWLEENMNSIVLGDSYELIKKIPDNSIDCIYTDPPYAFHQGLEQFKWRKNKTYVGIKGTTLTEGIDYAILPEFIRVMKYINIYIWCNKEQIKDYLNFFTNYDVLYDFLTWHKTNPSPMTHNTWIPDTEYCLYFRELGKVKLNDGYKLKKKYYISKQNKEDKAYYEHPTIKPYPFVRQHLLHSTQKGDIIFDPFSGSGTTCEVAKEIDRRFLGIEKDKKYHKISADRLNNIVTKTGQLGLFTNLELELEDL